jgi:hypothetical protein
MLKLPWTRWSSFAGMESKGIVVARWWLMADGFNLSIGGERSAAQVRTKLARPELQYVSREHLLHNFNKVDILSRFRNLQSLTMPIQQLRLDELGDLAIERTN